MNPQADVVKRSYMKFKVWRAKGSIGPGVQGPKNFKEFWFVFRALESDEKILEYYINERKFLEGSGLPKGIVHLSDVKSVQQHDPDKRNQFSTEMLDGSICFFEVGSLYEAEEWTTCLNAVLFGRGPNGDGMLQYNVELQDSPLLQYSDPDATCDCILEVKDGEIVVWKKDTFEEVVRWKLSHIRSFKAKKNLLTIYPGSRSSTGVGEFYFNSIQSVQITHAIETVVRNLKRGEGRRQAHTVGGTAHQRLSKATSAPHVGGSRLRTTAPHVGESRLRTTAPHVGGSRLRTTAPERRPLPALPPTTRSSPPTPQKMSVQSPPGDLKNVPSHIVPELMEFVNQRKMSAGTIANIPSFKPPEYEELPEIEEAESPPLPPREYLSQSPPAIVEEYGKLEHPHTRALNPNHTHPQEGYSRIERNHRSSPNLTPRGSPMGSPIPGSPSPSKTPSPTQRKEEVYEEIPGGPTEGYGKLERMPPTKQVSSVLTAEGYGHLERKSPTGKRKIVPPPKPLPYKPKPKPKPQLLQPANGEDVYSEIDQKAPVNIQVAALPTGYNKLQRDGTTVTGGSVKMRAGTTPLLEGYSRLDRHSTSELTTSEVHYGALEHFPPNKPPLDQTFLPEEYGKLDHPPPVESSTFDPYGSLSFSESYREGSTNQPQIFIDPTISTEEEGRVVISKVQNGNQVNHSSSAKHTKQGSYEDVDAPGDTNLTTNHIQGDTNLMTNHIQAASHSALLKRKPLTQQHDMVEAPPMRERVDTLPDSEEFYSALKRKPLTQQHDTAEAPPMRERVDTLPDSEEFYSALKRKPLTQQHDTVEAPPMRERVDTLPDSEEFYSALQHGLSHLRGEQVKNGVFEALCESSDLDLGAPPVPPRRGVSIRNSSSPPESFKTVPQTKPSPPRSRPTLPPKPKPKPKPRLPPR